MRNADEHKKLLAQIAELEKSSVNYFDVEKEFFLIDSNNLSQVRPKLYGYSIQETGIYEDDNLTPEAIANLDGRGCYVYVEVRDGKITIKQDLNGCWGIYLFRHGDYFAVSNSFFRLLDHIKYRYPLTVNRDYCHCFLLNDLCSHTYSETAINEIRLVERNAILQIDIAKQVLEIELINYKEHTVSPDSEEGIAILDRWIEFWGNVLRDVAQHTEFITMGLSGGFDTRMALLPLLHSGIDLNKVQFISYKGDLHTYKEDYEIASNIAEYYNIKLNQSPSSNQFLNYSLFDGWNIYSYLIQTFHKTFGLSPGKKRINKVYHIGGLAGETIRGNWLRFGSFKNFMESQMRFIKPYSGTLSQNLSNSMKNFLESAFREIGDKYNLDGSDDMLPQYLYQETRCRHHFGKFSVYKYLTNNITFSPAFDPEVRKVRLFTPECPDYQLLMALIFTRYAPDLLKFPFQGKRSIAPETIAYAQKINERFPRRVTTDKLVRGGQVFHLQPRDLLTEKILALWQNNPNIPRDLPEACLKAIFESSRTYGLFTAYFDEELYHCAANYYDTHVFERERLMYAICAVTKVLEDVEISQRNYSPYQDMKRFLKEDFCRIPNDAQIIKKFKNYFTARVDIKLETKGEANFQIVFMSDDKATVEKPAWFNKGGIGYVIQSYAGKLEIIAKATADGKIQLNLKGLDIRNSEDKSKRIPYWIDYTKLAVNGKIIFDKLTPVWHDKSYDYTLDAKDNKEIKIQVEWLPHRSDT